MYCIASFLSFTVFFFFLDILLLGLFSKQIFYCLFIFSLASMHNQKHWIYPVLFFILFACESFIQSGLINYHFCLYSFFYLLARFILNNHSSDLIIYYGILLFFLFTHILLSVNRLTLSFINPYTALKIIGNLILLCFSLKWLSAVKRGNRF